MIRKRKNSFLNVVSQLDPIPDVIFIPSRCFHIGGIAAPNSISSKYRLQSCLERVESLDSEQEILLLGRHDLRSVKKILCSLTDDSLYWGKI